MRVYGDLQLPETPSRPPGVVGVVEHQRQCTPYFIEVTFDQDSYQSYTLALPARESVLC